MSRSGSAEMNAHHAVLGLGLLCASGCGIGSVSPILLATDQQFDPRLVGSWSGGADHESALISGDASKGYTIVYTDADGKGGRFEGRLGRLGRYRVLDVRPAELQLDANDAYKSLLLPLHAAVFIDSLGSTVQFRLLDPDSLKQYLERAPDAVAHAIVDDAIVLTAPTAALRRFLVDYVRRKGVLGDSITWVRVQ